MFSERHIKCFFDILFIIDSYMVFYYIEIFLKVC